ncbi:MAG: YbaN family protein [Promethearchaeota archaeon]
MKAETVQGKKYINRKKVRRRKIINRLIFLGGTFTLILGIIGIVIPILPTTPFLLLTAAAYAKSSNRFYNWLLNNRILGMYIKNYKEGKGMPLKIKIFTISALWITISISLIFLTKMIWLQILLIGIAIAVSIHIIRIKPKS